MLNRFLVLLVLLFVDIELGGGGGVRSVIVVVRKMGGIKGDGWKCGVCK